MYGGNDLPLGPAGGFPKQRISTAGNVIAPVRDVEEVYLGAIARLPVVEKNFTSSVARAQYRMRRGRRMRSGKDARSLRPRFAPRSGVGEFEHEGIEFEGRE